MEKFLNSTEIETEISKNKKSGQDLPVKSIENLEKEIKDLEERKEKLIEEVDENDDSRTTFNKKNELANLEIEIREKRKNYQKKFN